MQNDSSTQITKNIQFALNAFEAKEVSLFREIKNWNPGMDRICSASTDLWNVDGLSRESQAQQAEEIIARRKTIVENADVFVKTINNREWWGQGQ